MQTKLTSLRGSIIAIGRLLNPSSSTRRWFNNLALDLSQRLLLRSVDRMKQLLQLLLPLLCAREKINLIHLPIHLLNKDHKGVKGWVVNGQWWWDDFVFSWPDLRINNLLVVSVFLPLNFRISLQFFPKSRRILFSVNRCLDLCVAHFEALVPVGNKRAWVHEFQASLATHPHISIKSNSKLIAVPANKIFFARGALLLCTNMQHVSKCPPTLCFVWLLWLLFCEASGVSGVATLAVELKIENWSRRQQCFFEVEPMRAKNCAQIAWCWVWQQVLQRTFLSQI